MGQRKRRAHRTVPSWEVKGLLLLFGSSSKKESAFNNIDTLCNSIFVFYKVTKYNFVILLCNPIFHLLLHYNFYMVAKYNSFNFINVPFSAFEEYDVIHRNKQQDPLAS